MRKILLLTIVAVLAANGVLMLGWPEEWYHLIPTVPHTGPFNPHFVRDIGCAYLVSAGAIAYFVFAPTRGRAAALTGCAFLVLHGVVHLWDVAAGRANFDHLKSDFIGVLAIPLLALFLCWPSMERSRGA